MRALGVEFAHEIVEPGLLLKAVHAGGAAGLCFEGEVHALVAAVLPGMAALDALDGDAEAQPPDREVGEVEQGVGAGERDAVVGADGAGQAAFAEQALEGGDDRRLAH